MSELEPDLRLQIEATVDRYLADNYAFETRQEIAGSEPGYSLEHWRQFAELGWLSIPFDTEFGGAGGAMRDLAQIMQLFGRALVTEPFVSTVGLAGTALAGCPNRQMREGFLPRVIAGELVLSLAYDEPAARGNPHCVATRAETDGKGYHLTGQKVVVMNAQQSDYLLVSARTAGDELDSEGISLFLLDTTTAGIHQEAYSFVDGHRAANLSFDLKVGPDALVTGEGDAGSLLSAAVGSGVLLLSAEAIGIMRALLDATVEYTSARNQFGVPLSSFQVLQHRMADMLIALERARCLLESVLKSSHGDGTLASSELHHLKVQVGRSGLMIGDAAVQLHGGMGMTDELNIGHYVKRLVSINQLLGNPDFHLRQTWKKLA